MKLLWRLITEPTNIWSRIIYEKYVTNNSIVECKRNVKNSWQFNRLLSLKDEFLTGIRWLVGDGTQIRFWEDNWIGNTNLKIYNLHHL